MLFGHFESAFVASVKVLGQAEAVEERSCMGLRWFCRHMESTRYSKRERQADEARTMQHDLHPAESDPWDPIAAALLPSSSPPHARPALAGQ